jgi:hypothetical protein
MHPYVLYIKLSSTILLFLFLSALVKVQIANAPCNILSAWTGRTHTSFTPSVTSDVGSTLLIKYYPLFNSYS